MMEINQTVQILDLLASLKNPVKLNIFLLIGRKRTVTFGVLRKETDLSKNTLNRHLISLKKSSLVKATGSDGKYSLTSIGCNLTKILKHLQRDPAAGELIVTIQAIEDNLKCPRQ